MEDLGPDNPAGRWVLDLSATCLDGLLASWGENLNQMKVICDSSKPLQEMQEPFKWRVGYSGEKQYVEIGGKRKLLTYSLADPIAFGKSNEFPGLQIADVIASAISYAMKNRDDGEANSWLQQIDAAHSVHDAILPGVARANVGSLDGLLNSMLLIELVRRAENGQSLLTGIEQLYESAPRAARDDEREVRAMSALRMVGLNCILHLIYWKREFSDPRNLRRHRIPPDKSDCRHLDV